jgi:dihydrofolate synthase / folylpolyglutamate synthase
MNIQPIKTHKIEPKENLFEILDKYLPALQEKSIVAIASKIVGICEGRVIKKESEEQKDKLVKQEAEYYLLEKHLGFLMTINHNMLVANAGIDESNSNGLLSLWPQDPQKSVNKIREYLTKKHGVKELGVILTDSKTTPLRWGVTGYALSHSGFNALNSYIGKKDIYGRKMHVEQLNIADSLATATAVVTGEGNEQQPFAVISDIPFVKFQTRNPTQKELDNLKINLADDMYASMLTAVDWKKGKKKI